MRDVIYDIASQAHIHLEHVSFLPFFFFFPMNIIDANLLQNIVNVLLEDLELHQRAGDCSA